MWQQEADVHRLGRKNFQTVAHLPYHIALLLMGSGASPHVRASCLWIRYMDVAEADCAESSTARPSLVTQLYAGVIHRRPRIN